MHEILRVTDGPSLKLFKDFHESSFANVLRKLGGDATQGPGFSVRSSAAGRETSNRCTRDFDARLEILRDEKDDGCGQYARSGRCA